MEQLKPFSRRVQLQAENVPYGLSPPFPKNVMFELTNGCNHSCWFCGNAAMGRPRCFSRGEMVKSVMSQARELGAEEVGFGTTGEPFLHSSLEELVQEASRLGYGYIYTSTNGALATPERLRRIVEAGLHSIKFTLGGTTRETYLQVHGQDDWETVQANLDFLLDQRKRLNPEMKVFITFMIIPENVHEISEIQARYGDGADELYLLKAHSQPGTQVAYGNFTKTPCHMLFNRAHVTAEGYLNACCIDFENHLALADLNQVPLAEAWNSPRFLELRRRHLEDDLGDTLCAQCVAGDERRVLPLAGELQGRRQRILTRR